MSVRDLSKTLVNRVLGTIGLRLTRIPGTGDVLDPVARSIARGVSTREHNSRENMDTIYADPNLMTHYFTSERLAFYGRVRQQVASLNLKPNDILDVGCGAGHLLSALADLYPGATTCGVDFSREAIGIARRVHPASRFEVMSIFELEKLQTQFDLVVCTEVIEHLEAADVAVEKLMSVCRQGGTVVITVPDGRQDTFAGHFNFWTPESFRREFRERDPSVEPFGAFLFITLRRS